MALGGALEPIVHAGAMSGRRKKKAAVTPQPEPTVTEERAAAAAPQGDGQKEPRRSRRTSTVLENRVGYRFADVALLTSALTHISALKGPRNRASSYQRMEFLGDHVLGLVISDMLYRSYPKADEGELSRRLADLVRKETCADIALEIELGAAIKLGSSEVNAGARKRPAILADVCEALIGAVYLDGGYPAAEGLVERLWHERMQATAQPLRDPKTILQEWAQARGLPTPAYQGDCTLRSRPQPRIPRRRTAAPIRPGRRVRPFQARRRTGRGGRHALARRGEDQDRAPQWLTGTRRTKRPRRPPPAVSSR